MSAGPRNVAVTPDGKVAFVTESGTGAVSVIDVETNTVIDTVAVGSSPLGIALTPALDDLLDNLTHRIVSFGLPNGIEASLLSSVDAVFASVERGKTSAVIGQLAALVNKIQAQQGKKIDDLDAEAVVRSIENLRGQLS